MLTVGKWSVCNGKSSVTLLNKTLTHIPTKKSMEENSKNEEIEIQFLKLKLRCKNPSAKSIIIIVLLLIFFWGVVHFLLPLTTGGYMIKSMITKWLSG